MFLVKSNLIGLELICFVRNVNSGFKQFKNLGKCVPHSPFTFCMTCIPYKIFAVNKL